MTASAKWCAAFAAALAFAGALVQIAISGGRAAVPGVMVPLCAGLAAGIPAFFVFKAKGAACVSRIAPFFPALAAAAALAMRLFGRRYRGGMFLPGGVNPMEAVKPLLVFFAAEMLARIAESAESGDARASRRAKVWAAAGFLVFAGSAAALNDFGLLTVLAATALCMAFLHSAKLGGIAFLAAAAAGAVFRAFPPAHVARRFQAWLDPFGDATGSGWQLLKAREVMAAGGVFGADFGPGGAAAYVPVASSDFVYAAIAGETGLAGCLALFALFAAFVWTGFAAATRARDPRSRLAAAGFVAVAAVQIVLNAGGVTGAVPMTGLTLPFVSHGGSSLAVTVASCLAMLGLAASAEFPVVKKRGVQNHDHGAAVVHKRARRRRKHSGD